MKKRHIIWSISVVILTVSGVLLLAQMNVREEISFPDILSYKTLKADFHTHTVFSDGSVWPHIRAQEAWREGLDVVAITDHIEYLPHKDDLRIDFNRSYEIAKPEGDDLKVTVLRGGEITRSMPPGHSNAIFLSDVEKLNVDAWEDAFAAAVEQQAFIFWNHPGWGPQLKDGQTLWYQEHSMLVEKGWLHGIEVVNERAYYPEAHAWCLEKNLTMLSNSDVHNPIGMDVAFHRQEHRPITLVFAKENSEKAIRDALFDRRTAVYSGHLLVGEEKWLLPLFMQSVFFDEKSIELYGEESHTIMVKNECDIDFKLKLQEEVENLSIPREITFYGGKTVQFRVRAREEGLSETKNYELKYSVENCLVAPNEGLPVEFKLKVKFRSE
jgi:hypothetical protein